MKSVFGFRVRLGNPDLDFENLNPDFPIERTPSSTLVFSKLQGLHYYFSDNFRCNLKFYESKNFSPSTKNCLTSGVKCAKLNIRNSWEIYIR